MNVPSRRLQIHTSRLVLRPTEENDADRAFEIQANWQVTRNLRMAAFPPSRRDMEGWFASHKQEWLEGKAYRFSILYNGRLIGLVDIGEIDGDEGDIGYWLDESFWGSGIATEVGEAVVRFAFAARQSG